MISAIFSLYRPRFARAIVYMLQADEYKVVPYLHWLWRTTNFNKVMRRKELVETSVAKALLNALRAGMLAQIVFAAWLIYRTSRDNSIVGVALSVVFLLSTPIVWAHLVAIPLALGRWMIIKPYYFVEIRRSGRIFKRHPAAKIAIAGSYGKTTMKEILAAILGEGQKVAATSGNRNVPISHARFARRLTGDEDILIIEYGEGRPGDVARFARITKPNMGVITGLAPAHLDGYKSLAAAGRDIFSLAGYLRGQDVYVNDESPALKEFLRPEYVTYDSKKVDGWKISKAETDLQGLRFTMKKGKKTLNINCGLIGMHLVGPMALAVYFADELGMSQEQIETAAAKIKPYEHRMQPYKLNGAWVVDDTYNGNIDGMKAGLDLLKKLPAGRKIYVTPGLVDQGAEERNVHLALGQAIKEAAPDKVVLMKHSVTDYIRQGMEGFKGEVIIEDDPLDFYTHMDKFVAEGDLVLLQNDWPDQYN